MPKYEVVLPVLNEEIRMPVGVKALMEYMQANCSDSWGIVIADNGSTDSTPAIAAQLTKAHPEISCIRLDAPGVGKALNLAWSNSTADIVGYMDVDMPTDLQTMQQVFSYFQEDGTGIFNGSRNSKTSVVRLRKPYRQFTSKSLNTLYRLILGVPIDDCMCGFKFMRRETYQRIAAAGVKNQGWFFCAEILAIAHHLGIPIHEVPVHWTDSPSDRAKVFALARNYIKAMFELRGRLKNS